MITLFVSRKTKIIKLAFTIIQILLFSFLSHKVYAQLDENYIETLDNKVSIGLSLGGVQNNFAIRSPSKDYNLNSNVVPSVGLWFKYKKWPSIAIGIPLTSLNADTLAKSQGFTFRLNSQIAKGFFIDGYVFFLKGFNFKRDQNSDFVRAMPNTVDLNANLELYYIFSYKKYSHKSAYLFGEIQKKSKGTFTIGLATGFMHLGNKRAFFSIEQESNSDIDFESIQSFTISVLGGYMHTFVFGKEKKWYANGSLFFGPNLHFGQTNYFHDIEKNGFLNVGFNAKYKAAIGYRINKLSFRLLSEGSFISYAPSSKSYLTNNIINLRLGCIYRF